MKPWRGLLHRLLGGSTDASGQPVHDPGDWVEVFDGLEPDVAVVREAFTDAVIEMRQRVYVPLGAAWGASTDPRTVVSVRAGDVRAANDLLDRVPHLGTRLAP
jgi:hypothetical protein